MVEHERAVRRAGGEPILVGTAAGLDRIDGLILPGGESTTIGKLLRLFDMDAPLKEKLLRGLPCFGTCAGLILLAKEIEGEQPHLGVMDIAVRRNAYGRQIDSFSAHATVKEFSPDPMELVFIRAPWIERVFGAAKALCSLDGHVVAARQNDMLVTSFHPELTADLRVHRYFLDMVRAAKDRE